LFSVLKKTKKQKKNAMLERVVVNMDIYREMARLVRRAEHSVIITSYVFSGYGLPGHIVCRALSEAAPHVKVRVLVNHPLSYGVKVSNRRLDMFMSMLNDNIEVREWRHHFINNLHSKFLVVDGRYALVCTSNVQPTVEQCNERDLGVTFDDDTVSNSLIAHFEDRWIQSVRTRRTFGEPSLEGKTSFDLPINPIEVYANVQDLVVKSQTACATCLSKRTSPISEFLRKALNSAQKSIDIISPNVSDHSLLDIMQHVVTERGVNVRVMTTFGQNRSTFKLLSMMTNKEFYEKYMNVFDIRFSNTRNIVKHHIEDENTDCVQSLDHTKLYIIDDDLVITGSFNADRFSTQFSDEVIVSFRGKASRYFCSLYQRRWEQSSA
jgi:phosphatidylserine/phosphatidylglycerophosphate/cardiolipin synthase-like enzyme